MMRNFRAHRRGADRRADELKQQGMEKLILDLRGNSGGYLNAAVDVPTSSWAARRRSSTPAAGPGSTEEYFSTEQPSDCLVPLVVLIDAGSASASEIVAGALQDWGPRAGRGAHQLREGPGARQYRLSNEGALLLTVARYYTPSGRLIQRPLPAGRAARLLPACRRGGLARTDGEPVAAAAPDTTGRPVYHTLLQGRDVYGGGGITPTSASPRSTAPAG